VKDDVVSRRKAFALYSNCTCTCTHCGKLEKKSNRSCNQSINADLSARRFADKIFVLPTCLADLSIRFCRRHKSDSVNSALGGGYN